ncbi:MAG: site-specific integrase [Emcibacter sp.]|nr:site-specific integrase [Emcibacter sp.]
MKEIQGIDTIVYLLFVTPCAFHSAHGDTMLKIELIKFHIYCKEQLGLSGHSLRAYRQDLNAFLKYLSANKAASLVTHELLVSYHRAEEIVDE